MRTIVIRQHDAQAPQISPEGSPEPEPRVIDRDDAGARPAGEQTADGTFRVLIVDGATVIRRWDDIEAAMRHAFDGSAFNDGFAVWRPLTHTREGAEGPGREKYRHALALNADDAIIGGFFRVPVQREPEETDADLGWFFASVPDSDAGYSRRDVADEIVITANALSKRAGFSRIVTNMGTAAGARFLRDRHSYIHEPLTHDKQNRWEKYL